MLKKGDVIFAQQTKEPPVESFEREAVNDIPEVSKRRPSRNSHLRLKQSLDWVDEFPTTEKVSACA